MEKVLPEGKFDETSHSREGEALDMPSERPDAGLLDGSQSVSLYIEKTNQYVNINSDGWAVIQDIAVTTYSIVPYSGGRYYIVVANGSYEGDYLSYNNNYYVGAYSSWSNACWWSNDPIDCLSYPGLYPYNGYLCVNGVNSAPNEVVTVVTK